MISEPSRRFKYTLKALFLTWHSNQEAKKMFSVKYFQFFAVFIIAFSNVFANILINDKLCDPSGSNYIPYSGLRFYKKNELSIINSNDEENDNFLNKKYNKKNQGLPSYKSNILVSICSNGKNLFNINNHLHDKETNMNWNSTICLKFNHLNQVKGKSSSTNLFHKIFSKQVLKDLNSAKNFKVKELIDFGPILATNDAFINNITEEYFNYQEIYNSLMESDIKCFKFARNEKYHSRKLQIFKPFSQIGGIFQCHLNEFTYSNVAELFDTNSRTENLEKTKFIDIIEMKNFDCNRNIPISPLYSDNVYFQWIKLKFTPFFLSKKNKTKLRLQYFLPLFYTPNDINNNYLLGHIWQLFKQFKHSLLGKKNLNKWYSKIDINEIYNDMESENLNKVQMTLKKLSKQVNLALNNFDEIVIEVIKTTKKIVKADLNLSKDVEEKDMKLQADNNVDFIKNNDLLSEILKKLYDNVELDNDSINNRTNKIGTSASDNTFTGTERNKILENSQNNYIQTSTNEDVFASDKVKFNHEEMSKVEEETESILKNGFSGSIDKENNISEETDFEIGNDEEIQGEINDYKLNPEEVELLGSQEQAQSGSNLVDANMHLRKRIPTILEPHEIVVNNNEEEHAIEKLKETKFIKEIITKETFSFFYNNLNFSERLMFFVCIIKRKKLLGINLESFFKQLIST